jgi:hypothetical protein
MSDLNLWRFTEDLAEDYLSYKHVHEELALLFTREASRPQTLYDVEHVFWFKGGNPLGERTPLVEEVDGLQAERISPIVMLDRSEPFARLPDSYIPPIIAILPQMAANDPNLVEAAKASGTSLERAFEKGIHAALTILGFETKLLGQGQGRVPDGLALDNDNSYALLWDGKIRSGGYSMGTDDRSIRDYIIRQSRELKRRALRNIYYVVVSSSFKDDYDDTIRSLKMETEISEVVLLEAEALVAIVDLKLRDPLQLPLGPDGLQRLFSVSGVVTPTDVQETLG